MGKVIQSVEFERQLESVVGRVSVNGWQHRVSQTSLARKSDSYLSFLFKKIMSKPFHKLAQESDSYLSFEQNYVWKLWKANNLFLSTKLCSKLFHKLALKKLFISFFLTKLCSNFSQVSLEKRFISFFSTKLYSKLLPMILDFESNKRFINTRTNN